MPEEMTSGREAFANKFRELSFTYFAQTGTSPTSALHIALGLVTLGAFAMFVISMMRLREI